MNTSANNLLDEISQVFIEKLNAQNLDPVFLQRLFDDLLKKVLFANTKKITLPETDEVELADTWSSKIKKAFNDLTQDKEYETKYKQFLKRAFDTSKINSLIPGMTLSNNLVDNLNDYSVQNTTTENDQPTLVKELKTETITTRELITDTDNIQRNIDQPKKQNEVLNVEKAIPEIAEIKVTIDKELSDNKKTNNQEVKETLTGIKELKTESIIVNNLQTNTIKDQSEVTKEIKTGEILNQLPVVDDKREYDEGRVSKIKDTPVIHLDGITPNGQNALTNVFKPLLENIFGDLAKRALKSKEGTGNEEGADTSFLTKALAAAAGSAMFYGAKTLLPKIFKPLTSALSKAGTMLARVGGPIAAVVGGNYIGGKVGEMIGSNETASKFLYGSETAGKEAYEKYGTGVPGLVGAVSDTFKQSGEAAELHKEHQRMSQERIEKSKESLAGKAQYDPKKEAKLQQSIDEMKQREEKLKKQYEELKAQAWDGWNPFHDEEKETESRTNLEGLQESITIAENRLAEFKKLKDSSSPQIKTTSNKDKEQDPEYLRLKKMFGKPKADEVWNQRNNLNNKSQQLRDANQTEGTFREDKLDVEKPTIRLDNTTPTQKPLSLFSDDITQTTLMPQTDKAGLENITSDSTESMSLDKIFNPEQFTLNNSSLNEIASNTSDTNASLKSLSESLFKLVNVFDKKLNLAGNTTVINGVGQTSKSMPASVIANSNIDPIRRVRMQFA